MAKEEYVVLTPLKVRGRDDKAQPGEKVELDSTAARLALAMKWIARVPAESGSMLAPGPTKAEKAEKVAKAEPVIAPAPAPAAEPVPQQATLDVAVLATAAPQVAQAIAPAVPEAPAVAEQKVEVPAESAAAEAPAQPPLAEAPVQPAVVAQPRKNAGRQAK